MNALLFSCWGPCYLSRALDTGTQKHVCLEPHQGTSLHMSNEVIVPTHKKQQYVKIINTKYENVKLNMSLCSLRNVPNHITKLQ